jgi:glutamate-1-semialdehyde 2,1-aminomutase
MRNIVEVTQRGSRMAGVGRKSEATSRKPALKAVPTKKSAKERRGEAVSAYVHGIFSQPWMNEVMAELQERQPKSLALMAELRQLEVSATPFWPFISIQMPMCMERAEGSRLWDIDGNEYIDLFMGFGAQSLHGHNPEPVVRFVKDLMGKAVGNCYCAPLELEYMRLLRELVPHREKFMLLNSGSDAISAAIRLARAYSGRQLVVRFEGAINGQHDIMAYNAHPNLHGHPLIPFPPRRGTEIPLHSFNRGNQVLGKKDLLVLNFGDPASLEIIKKRKDEIACVVSEAIPICLPYPDKAIPFVRELGEVCRKSGVILTLDEVTTGFRYGISGVTGHFDLHADLVTYGKVMTGLGIPLSAVAGRSDILEMGGSSGSALHDYGQKTFLATSHAGNHLAIAASYATLSLLKEKGPAFYERTTQKVERLRSRVAQLEVQPGVSLNLVGCGAYVGSLLFQHDQPIENIREYVNSYLPIAGMVLAMLLRRKGIHFNGFMVYLGDAHSEQDLDTLFVKVQEALEEMKRNQFPFVPSF